MPCPYTLRYDIVLHLSGNRYIKERHIEEDITQQEKASIISSQLAYQEGDYLTLDEYEARRG